MTVRYVLRTISDGACVDLQSAKPFGRDLESARVYNSIPELLDDVQLYALNGRHSVSRHQFSIARVVTTMVPTTSIEAFT